MEEEDLWPLEVEQLGERLVERRGLVVKQRLAIAPKRVSINCHWKRRASEEGVLRAGEEYRVGFDEQKGRCEMSEKLLPCPFCGEIPKLPDGKGTQYEIECSCGHAYSSVQISDLMTIGERISTGLITTSHYKYPKEFIKRARDQAITAWNTRTNQAMKGGGP